MPLYEFTAPCHFGMEAVLKREIINLGMKSFGWKMAV